MSLSFPRHSGRLLLNPILWAAAVNLLAGTAARASDADLAIPDLWKHGTFDQLGGITPGSLLFWGSFVILGTLGISLYQLYADSQTAGPQVDAGRFRDHLPDLQNLPHPAGQIPADALLLHRRGHGVLLARAAYMPGFPHEDATVKATEPTAFSPLTTLGIVLFFALVGMGGSYAVAWYGIRVNTFANSRTAFASLRGQPWDVVNIPLRAGMSIGLFLISLELVMMVIILLSVPRQIVGFCFLGFAIGESLGASALRIAGGIFTKIADIGSDLMKIVFNVKEDDPRNPGVIADCTGDNAGDSVGPTADGFETYGVTGVALITFITLAVTQASGVANYLDVQAKLIVWIFAMRFLMDFMSGVSYFINQAISEANTRG